MERPTLRQLEYAVAVADRRSFRRAAEACYVTQPALSAQIRLFEERLGFPLFERDRRRVLVTPEGALVVERARRALAEVDGLVEAARGLDEPLAGELKLGVLPTIAPYVLPTALAGARRAHPRLRLFLREDRTSELVERTRRGELDLVLLALEADLADLATLPLYHDPFLLALPREHPLARRRRVRENDVPTEEVLLLEDGHCLREQALSICRVAGAREAGDFRASSLNTLVRMVAGRSGVTLLPALAAPVEVRPRDRLALVPFIKGGAKRAPGRTIGFAWRRSSPRRREFQLLAESFLRHAPKGVERVG